MSPSRTPTRTPARPGRARSSRAVLPAPGALIRFTTETPARSKSARLARAIVSLASSAPSTTLTRVRCTMPPPRPRWTPPPAPGRRRPRPPRRTRRSGSRPRPSPTRTRTPRSAGAPRRPPGRAGRPRSRFRAPPPPSRRRGCRAPPGAARPRAATRRSRAGPGRGARPCRGWRRRSRARAPGRRLGLGVGLLALQLGDRAHHEVHRPVDRLAHGRRELEAHLLDLGRLAGDDHHLAGPAADRAHEPEDRLGVHPVGVEHRAVLDAGLHVLLGDLHDVERAGLAALAADVDQHEGVVAAHHLVGEAEAPGPRVERRDPRGQVAPGEPAGDLAAEAVVAEPGVADAGHQHLALAGGLHEITSTSWGRKKR